MRARIYDNRNKYHNGQCQTYDNDGVIQVFHNDLIIFKNDPVKTLIIPLIPKPIPMNLIASPPPSDATNVSDIAILVGYDNISYFHRIFAKQFGLSPKKYRACK